MKEFLLAALPFIICGMAIIVILVNTKKQKSKDHYLSLGMLMVCFKKDKSSRWIRMNY